MAANVFVYRRSGGRLGAKVKGAPVLLLDHVGRNSGVKRTSPVLYLKEGEELVIVASRSGSDAMPAWWLNIKAAGRATVEIRRERRDCAVRQATAEEKQRLWPRLVEMFPDYDVYQSRTTREIPVAVLSPVS